MSSIRLVTVLVTVSCLFSKVTADCANLFSQCGGEGWTGVSCCATGSCVSQNQYYYQCRSTAGSVEGSTSTQSIIATTSADLKSEASDGYNLNYGANNPWLGSTLKTSYVRSLAETGGHQSTMTVDSGDQSHTYGTFSEASPASSVIDTDTNAEKNVATQVTEIVTVWDVATSSTIVTVSATVLASSAIDTYTNAAKGVATQAVEVVTVWDVVTSSDIVTVPATVVVVQAASSSVNDGTDASISYITATTTFASATRTADHSTTWDPPSSLVTPLTEVWAHEMSTYDDPTGYMNYGYDQLMAHDGRINYCVRWETNTTKLTETYRNEIEAALQKQYSKWMDWLIGYDGFPYSSVPVEVVGWAVYDEDLIEGDTTGLHIYTDKDSNGVPECSDNCSRFLHPDGVYSDCSGGSSQHFDHSLWLTEGMDTTGTGGFWGQRVGLEYFIDSVENGTENLHIYLHEVGHTYALDDFYDWQPDNETSFIMLAGSSKVITQFDGWMMRDWWTNLKSRYNLTDTSS